MAFKFWKRDWQFSGKVSLLVRFTKMICRRTEDDFVETIHSAPLGLEVYAEGTTGITIRVEDHTDNPGTDRDFLLYSSYCTPDEESLGRPVPPKYMDKICTLLTDAICFVSYLAKPCCKGAKKNALFIFGGRVGMKIENCPWCGDPLWQTMSTNFGKADDGIPSN